MVIRRGEPWGAVVPRPADLAVAANDAGACRSSSPVELTGGDLLRTVGGAGRLGETVTLAPVDVVRVDAGGRSGSFVAHLVARRSWWRGEIVAAMNAQYLGEWDVAPRAHPNDGKVDVVRVDPAMSVRDRLRARARLRTGTHVPHPAISVRQSASVELTFRRPLDVWLDGVRWLRTAHVTLTVDPDALTVAW